MQIFRIQISTHFHLSTFCAWVSDYGYIISGSDTCTNNFMRFLRIFYFFGQNVISNIFFEFYINWNAKPNQISILPSEVFDGSLVKLVIVSSWRTCKSFFFSSYKYMLVKFYFTKASPLSVHNRRIYETVSLTRLLLVLQISHSLSVGQQSKLPDNSIEYLSYLKLEYYNWATILTNKIVRYTADPKKGN